MQDRLSSPDVYGRTHRLDPQTVEAIATRLERRGKHPFFIRVIEEYLAELDLDAARAVLDFGCGTGIVARALARRPDFSGAITALDISADLVEAGRRHATAEGVAGRIDFKVGDAHSLDLGEGASTS